MMHKYPTKKELIEFQMESTNTENILDKIQNIRETNNKNWMAILKLAFKHAPREAKLIMKNITEYDQQINELSKELIQ